MLLKRNVFLFIFCCFDKKISCFKNEIKELKRRHHEMLEQQAKAAVLASSDTVELSLTHSASSPLIGGNKDKGKFFMNEHISTLSNWLQQGHRYVLYRWRAYIPCQIGCNKDAGTLNWCQQDSGMLNTDGEHIYHVNLVVTRT